MFCLFIRQYYTVGDCDCLVLCISSIPITNSVAVYMCEVSNRCLLNKDSGKQENKWGVT